MIFLKGEDAKVKKKIGECLRLTKNYFSSFSYCRLCIVIHNLPDRGLQIPPKCTDGELVPSSDHCYRHCPES